MCVRSLGQGPVAACQGQSRCYPPAGNLTKKKKSTVIFLTFKLFFFKQKKE
jgi:hypothetical protein